MVSRAIDYLVRLLCVLLARFLPCRHITRGYTEEPYLERYLLFNCDKNDRRRWSWLPQIHLHHFVGDDDDVLHDHPWEAWSLVLAGSYVEWRKEGVDGTMHTRILRPWRVNRIHPSTFHMIALLPGVQRRDCWTLFITGRRRKSWGFLLNPRPFSPAPQEYVHWQEHVRRAAIKACAEQFGLGEALLKERTEHLRAENRHASFREYLKVGEQIAEERTALFRAIFGAGDSIALPPTAEVKLLSARAAGGAS